MFRIPAISSSVCVLAFAQTCFAEEDQIQRLQSEVARLELQVHEVEVPVFQNLKTVVFACDSFTGEGAPFPVALRAKLKKRLESAGIRVFGENNKGTKYPNFNIDLFLLPGHPGEIEVRAELHEWTLLRRNGKSIILSTWNRKEQLVPANDEERANLVASITNKFMDEFVAEYAACNPPKPGQTGKR